MEKLVFYTSTFSEDITIGFEYKSIEKFLEDLRENIMMNIG